MSKMPTKTDLARMGVISTTPPPPLLDYPNFCTAREYLTGQINQQLQSNLENYCKKIQTLGAQLCDEFAKPISFF